jgi:hypothetical protein
MSHPDVSLSNFAVDTGTCGARGETARQTLDRKSITFAPRFLLHEG